MYEIVVSILNWGVQQIEDKSLIILSILSYGLYLVVIIKIIKEKESFKKMGVFILGGFLCFLIQGMWKIGQDKNILNILLLIDFILTGIFIYEWVCIKRNKATLKKIVSNISMLTLFGLLARVENALGKIAVIIMIFLFYELWLCLIDKRESTKICRDTYKAISKKEEEHSPPLYASREKIKDNLVKKINDICFNVDKSYTIAIHDNWGRGKTFFLDKVLKELNGKENSKIYEDIHINTLLLTEEESLLNILDREFAEIFKKYGYASKLSQSQEYLKLLGDIVQNKSGIGIVNFLNTLKPSHSINESRAKFKEIIKALYDNEVRVIIVFDDIDRCSEEQIRNFFGVLYHVVGIRYITNIICFEQGYLEKTNNSFDHEYVRKFYDEKVTLPEPNIKDKVSTLKHEVLVKFKKEIVDKDNVTEEEWAEFNDKINDEFDEKIADYISDSLRSYNDFIVENKKNKEDRIIDDSSRNIKILLNYILRYEFVNRELEQDEIWGNYRRRYVIASFLKNFTSWGKEYTDINVRTAIHDLKKPEDGKKIWEEKICFHIIVWDGIGELSIKKRYDDYIYRIYFDSIKELLLFDKIESVEKVFDNFVDFLLKNKNDDYEFRARLNRIFIKNREGSLNKLKERFDADNLLMKKFKEQFEKNCDIFASSSVFDYLIGMNLKMDINLRIYMFEKYIIDSSYNRDIQNRNMGIVKDYLGINKDKIEEKYIKILGEGNYTIDNILKLTAIKKEMDRVNDTLEKLNETEKRRILIDGFEECEKLFKSILPREIKRLKQLKSNYNEAIQSVIECFDLDENDIKRYTPKLNEISILIEYFEFINELAKRGILTELSAERGQVEGEEISTIIKDIISSKDTIENKIAKLKAEKSKIKEFEERIYVTNHIGGIVDIFLECELEEQKEDVEKKGK